ncbi:MAG: DUF305 domain-containing protein [Pseudomonadales bacterium]|nr:DUF305 domain-containing protein [Pseudomonadales bacterium]
MTPLADNFDLHVIGRALRRAGLVALLGWFSAPALSQPPIIQPGAPGEPARELSADEAIRIAVTRFSPADVRFMQDMIPHHHQALEMAALAPARTNRAALLEIARRIDASQSGEIGFMQEWLAARGQPAPDPADHSAMHAHHTMAGMATPEQMAALAAARATEFDRLFLELMIRHHDGALKMVEKLLEQPGSAFDPVLYEFTTSITNDQSTEIERMNALLVTLSTDPRAGLAAGLEDAGEAILHLRKLATLPRPPGFFDPDNPAELPPRAPAAADSDGSSKNKASDEDERYPLLSFSNTDMAFAGDVLVAGNYHGFNIYRLDMDGIPLLVSSVVCPGGQGDVSIVGNLLIMSVEQTRGRLDCGLQGVDQDVSAERFRGLRIFDISDLARPVQVGAVQTCRGSHTHSVVVGPGPDGKVIVYNSGISDVRKAEELDGCIDDQPGDLRTALFRIDVIEIPVDDPGKARIVGSPAVFADAEDGALAGLWRGGRHGDDTQETERTDHCHDITVFPELGIAAGACSGNGILFDITDPANPRRMHEVVDPGFAYWHSATFNNDGTKVIFTDEWGGGMRAHCRAHDPMTWGANAIYDIVDGRLVFRSYFKMPAPQVDQENCVAHNGSIVPVPGRDIFVQAWYQGGISLIDFTDSANPVEIGYFDRGPIDPEHLVIGGYWSVYAYGGRIYGTEIVRGLDVFELVPSEYVSANEVAAMRLADQGGLFNPQQQFRVVWPAEPVVARTYLDQLSRDGQIEGGLAAEISATLDAAEAGLERGERDRRLASRLASLAGQTRTGQPDAPTAQRRAALAQILAGVADRLGRQRGN